MVREDKVVKKSYSAPSFQALDPAAAKVKLEAVGATQDGNAQTILSAIKKQLDAQPSAAPSAANNLVPQ